MIICSDGRVFSDVVSVPDEHITAYAEGIDAIIKDFDLTHLKTFSMDEHLPDKKGDELRRELLLRFSMTTEEVREKARSNPSLFNGLHRFMIEDQAGVLNLSRNQISKMSGKIPSLFPMPFIFRVARAEIKILNHPVKPGDVIFISTHCINRDLPEEERPREIDFNRRSQHFAYGHGPHYCLGAKLGRLEIRLLFEEILSSVPPFRLDETKGASRDHYSLSFSGWEQLPLTTR